MAGRTSNQRVPYSFIISSFYFAKNMLANRFSRRPLLVAGSVGPIFYLANAL
jgi:hypothetical protein